MYASDDSVEVVQVPSMIDAAELYVKESGLAQRLTPPNGRQKILSRHSVESCTHAALVDHITAETLQHLHLCFFSPRYIISSDCSGAGTLNYCMSIPQSQTVRSDHSIRVRVRTRLR